MSTLKTVVWTLTKLLLGVFIVGFFAYGPMGWVPKLPLPVEVNAWLIRPVGIVLGLGAYLGWARWIDRRAPVELAWPPALKETAQGLLMGFTYMSAVVALLWLAGSYRVIDADAGRISGQYLWLAVFAGVIEELITRGILFRLLESMLGSVGALLLSAAFFGFAHLGNPNSGLLPAIAISLEAGLLLGAAFMVTRRLWLPIGLHAAWNATQSGVYGVATSGFAAKGWLRSETSGPEWLSGGAFGAEASLIAVIGGVALSLWFLHLARQRGHFVAPLWKRQSAGLGDAPQAPLGGT